jgi:hypothetical protein
MQYDQKTNQEQHQNIHANTPSPSLALQICFVLKYGLSSKYIKINFIVYPMSGYVCAVTPPALLHSGKNRQHLGCDAFLLLWPFYCSTFVELKLA